jgi:predicted transcriptional regulator
LADEVRVGAESRRFVTRLFGGKLSPLIAQMAEEEAIDDADVAEIEALLRRLKA